MQTDPGTGTVCVCGHGSDLHDLEDIKFVDSDEDCLRLQWRMRCRGAWSTDISFAAPCTCTSFKLQEGPPSVEEKEESDSG